MRKVDGFLSRQAQEEWPTAIVWKEEASTPGNGNGSEDRFILERHGVEDVLLGSQFKEARAGLVALLSRERSKGQDGQQKEVDSFLTQQAQEEWPTAIVWKEEASTPGNGNGNGSKDRFILERHGVEDVLLGSQFKEARAGLVALLSSERSKKTIEGKEN